MEIAVIKTGGKQFVVAPGTMINIEKLPGVVEKGDTVVFDEVLMVDDGSVANIGAPMIAGAKVSGTVTLVGRHKKIDVMKYKAKSRYFKRRGHRQPYVQVKIDTIA